MLTAVFAPAEIVNLGSLSIYVFKTCSVSQPAPVEFTRISPGARCYQICALRFDIDTARDDTKRLRLLNLRLGSESVPGVFKTEAYLDAYNKTASEGAELILARLELLRTRLADTFEPLRPSRTSPSDIPFFDDVPLYFQNREPEQAKIRTFILHPSMRLLRVFGASGNGKTVLVHRVLNELMAASAFPRHFKTVIVLNAAQPDGISIGSLVSGLTEQLKLPRPLHQRQGDVASQLLSILSEIRRERVVVFIDEFELVVDNTTRGTKPEAAALISLILRQVRSPLKLILTTVFGLCAGIRRSARLARVSEPTGFRGCLRPSGLGGPATNRLS